MKELKFKKFAGPFAKSAALTAASFLILYLSSCYGCLQLVAFIFIPLCFFLTSFLIFQKQKIIRRFLEKRYEQIIPFLHNFDEGILFLDKSCCVNLYNRSFCRIMGVKSSDLKKQSFFQIEIPEKKEVLEKCKHLLERCRKFKSRQKEMFYSKKEEIPFSIEITIAQLSQEEYLLILKESSKEGSSFNMGKDFIANASHELRTPITIIKGFVETLKEIPEISEAMLEDIFDKILRSCVRMDNIVKKLLLLTDLDHLSKARMGDLNLLALLENCRHSLLGVYPIAEVSIKSDAKEVMVQADPDLLEVAIMNLLQNAVKYSPSPAKITITLESMAEDLGLEIADRGVGIPEKSLPHIFDRFYAVDKAVSRKLGGVGLGLSIVKAIVEKHQGQIAARPNPEGGTIFTIKIPKK